MCKQANIQSWNLKKYLFDTLVTLVIMYGVEVWGGSLSKDRWNDIEKIQKLFLTKFLVVRRTTPYPILLLETGSMPLEALGMEQLLKYIKKINRMPKDRIPLIAWKASCRPQKTRKSKLLASGWMLDNEKWLDRWDAKALLRHPTNDPMAITACLQRQLIKRWEEQNSSRLKHYIEEINTNFKAQYYKEKWERPVAYLLESVNISAQRKVASIRTGSHNL